MRPPPSWAAPIMHSASPAGPTTSTRLNVVERAIGTFAPAVVKTRFATPAWRSIAAWTSWI